MFLNSTNRIIGLDVLRSIAILLVLYQHSIFLISSPNELYQIRIDGVSIFFVLSGFLIGNILIKTFSESAKLKAIFRFFIFRWTKTLPSYYFVLIFIYFYFLFTKQNLSDFSLNYIVFTQNLFCKHPEFFKEAWSLSIEEWFYIIFPIISFLMVYFYKKVKLTIIYLSIIFILFSTFMRLFHYSQNEHLVVNEILRKIVLYRFDSIIFGVICACAYFYYPKKWNSYKFLFLFIGFILLIIFEIGITIYPPFYFSLESLIIVCFLPYLSIFKEFNLTILNFIFSFISKISYSLYLVNLTIVQIIFMPVLKKYVSFLYPVEYLQYIYFWVLTFIFAFLLNKFIEKPFLKLRNKF
jgi:peptidoglycan/LPS O-acetylase OafA/YrhL